MRIARFVAGEIHRRVRELVVRADEVARVGQLGRMEPVQVGGHDQRGQPLAEAGGHVERARRTVAKQVDALQRAPSSSSSASTCFRVRRAGA